MFLVLARDNRAPQPPNICIRILCNVDTILHNDAPPCRLRNDICAPQRARGTRRNALTEQNCFPTPKECASSREQMCSGSKDQR
jgi:hypothetical protein